MARKIATVVIDAEGRDYGKVFQLREMPAMQAERWAMRALLALAKSGVEIPENIANAGLAGVAALGLKAFGGLDFADAEPLLTEMMSCVQIIPDPAKPQIVRFLVDDDIEEVPTLLKLRAEVFSLHTGFSLPAAASKSTSTTTGKKAAGRNT